MLIVTNYEWFSYWPHSSLSRREERDQKGRRDEIHGDFFFLSLAGGRRLYSDCLLSPVER